MAVPHSFLIRSRFGLQSSNQGAFKWWVKTHEIFHRVLNHSAILLQIETWRLWFAGGRIDEQYQLVRWSLRRHVIYYRESKVNSVQPVLALRIAITNRHIAYGRSILRISGKPPTLAVDAQSFKHFS